MKIENIEEKGRNYKKNLMRARCVVIIGMIISVLTAPFLSFLGVELHLPDPIPQYVGRLIMGMLPVIGMVITILIAYPFQRKWRKYRLEDYEWVQFYSKLIVENIEEYRKERTPELKNDHKKKAINLGEELLSYIRRKWQVGSFQLVKNYLGESISDFITNFQNKVIPNLKEMNDKSSEDLEAIMRKLFFESKGLKLESIEILNKRMAKLTDVTVTPTSIERLQAILRTTKREHGLFLLSLVVLWIIVDSLALYIGMPNEVIYSTTIVGIITIIAIYINSKRKVT